MRGIETLLPPATPVRRLRELNRVASFHKGLPLALLAFSCMALLFRAEIAPALARLDAPAAIDRSR